MDTVSPASLDERLYSVRRLCDQPSEFAPEFFTPGPENLECIRQAKILVIGAGGLGCELLKDLALSGFAHIEVIDMDTIDVSNLNRQFLFREADVGKPKAEVAAAFVSRRVPTCRVIPHHCPIESKGPAFYKSFNIVVCGLDSIKARRWINSMLCDLVHTDSDGEIDPGTIIPMVDGGTEGFKGNVRVIYPKMSACVECLLDLYPPQINFPMCTIAHTPRLPEHCVEYVKVVEWPKAHTDGESLDADKPEHVEWVLKRAQQRAENYKISGVDYRLCLGVLKRIIPAVASTNAVVAASCTLEVLKLTSNAAFPLNNYLNFSQTEGVHFGVVELERSINCIACGNNTVQFSADPAETFEEFLEKLKEKYQLSAPDVRIGSDKALYVISDLFPDLLESSQKNLLRKTAELFDEASELLVSDPTLTRALSIRIEYAK
ncbi:unnamed protein product, partial [Mesorhabditis spiculigera]